MTPKFQVEIMYSRDQCVTQEQLSHSFSRVPPLHHFSKMSLPKVNLRKKTGIIKQPSEVVQC